jgi:hypothetical protein
MFKFSWNLREDWVFARPRRQALGVVLTGQTALLVGMVTASLIGLVCRADILCILFVPPTEPTSLVVKILNRCIHCARNYRTNGHA